MSIHSLTVSLVLQVPDTKCLVIGRRHRVLPTWVENNASNPVIMSNLQQSISTTNYQCKTIATRKTLNI